MPKHYPLSHIRLNPAPEAESASDARRPQTQHTTERGKMRRKAPRRPDLSAYSLSALRTASMARA